MSTAGTAPLAGNAAGRISSGIEPLCRLCLEAGRVTPATVADHVTPHRGDFTAFRLGELRSLCADCHNSLDGTKSPPPPSPADDPPPTPTHPRTRPPHPLPPAP